MRTYRFPAGGIRHSQLLCIAWSYFSIKQLHDMNFRKVPEFQFNAHARITRSATVCSRVDTLTEIEEPTGYAILKLNKSPPSVNRG